MKPVIVTKELISVGLAVMRGRDWNYTTIQDGKPGNRGRVIQIDEPANWCTVEWEKGGRYVYRVGYNEKFDLYAYLPGYYDPKPSNKNRLTPDNCKVGLKVQLNEMATGFAREKLALKGELIIEGGGYDDVKFKGIPGSFKFGSFDICTDQSMKITTDSGLVPKSQPVGEPVYKFREGNVVYMKAEKHDGWTKYSGVQNNYPYLVIEATGTTMKLQELSHWQLQDQFMSESEWLKQAYTQTALPKTAPQVDMGRLQKNVVAIAENSKPNIKQNGTSNKHSEPIKVRRPISTIQGSKRRSRTVFTGRGSSAGSRISNY